MGKIEGKTGLSEFQLFEKASVLQNSLKRLQFCSGVRKMLMESVLMLKYLETIICECTSKTQNSENASFVYLFFLFLCLFLSREGINFKYVYNAKVLYGINMFYFSGIVKADAKYF